MRSGYVITFYGEEVTRDAEIAQAFRQMQHDKFYWQSSQFRTYLEFHKAAQKIVEIP